MITDSIEKHQTEQEFYTHIRFYNLLFHHKSLVSGQELEDGYFTMRDIQLGNEELGAVFNRISLTGKVNELKVNVSKESYRYEDGIKKAEEEIAEKSEAEKLKLTKILTKVKKGYVLSISEVGELSWVWYEIYECIRFQPIKEKISEIQTMLETEINRYLDNFINDKLSIVKKNYYKFETQKRMLIKLIEEDRKLQIYGNNFIIREKIDHDGNLLRITKTDYDKKLETLKDEQQRLGIKLEEYTQADYNYKTTVSTILSISRRAKQIFDSSETHEKRAFVNFLLQNPVVEDKKLLFSLKKPWDVVLELATTPRWLALLRDFRAFDWIKEYKYPTVMLDQMKGLLAKYENV